MKCNTINCDLSATKKVTFRIILPESLASIFNTNQHVNQYKFCDECFIEWFKEVTNPDYEGLEHEIISVETNFI